MADYVKSLQRTPSKRTRSRIDPLDIYSVPPRKQVKEIAQKAQLKKLGHIRKTLDKFYAPIEKMDTTTLDRDDLAELGIKVKTCDSFDEPDDDYRTFFKPLPEDTLDQYPMDKDTPCPKAIKRPNATIAWGFWKAKREGFPQNQYGYEQSLALITGWIGSAPPLFSKRLCVGDSVSLGSLFYRSFPAAHTWERLDSSKPHFMFTMTLDVEPTERLLKEEALQIMAAIKTRISSEFIDNNNQIIPIQMFSFMQNYGRILHAFYNGKRLVIRKTRLYAFEDENAPFDLFIRHLASEPVGYTRELKRK
ncbi:hypothetical protein ASPWEDRAFT_166214 [Aspergillus wentii DTO 134E9]|uniref:Uncharacterized protein n=1 Tax=Aspergillus wentii DTO 134E9 TaxID=1073089 RepID=A0A1L9RZ90_ASPWE|nr:uncharacterized protein ASPWEDRAFT_166214 [Aspergillus wentii DTO 134E9]OJJ40128.1 hypothetical protein ASPWEDRAFT_166214 [Aspergillus wentii DTO 134E9]